VTVAVAVANAKAFEGEISVTAELVDEEGRRLVSATTTDGDSDGSSSSVHFAQVTSGRAGKVGSSSGGSSEVSEVSVTALQSTSHMVESRRCAGAGPFKFKFPFLASRARMGETRVRFTATHTTTTAMHAFTDAMEASLVVEGQQSEVQLSTSMAIQATEVSGGERGIYIYTYIFDVCVCV
jgi:hypothetical protein